MWWKLVKDLLFPIYCVGCGQEGEWWCQACRAKEPIKLQHWCAECEIAIPFLGKCARCVETPLQGVTALFYYAKNAPVAKLIHQYKYEYAREIKKVWEEIVGGLALTIPPDMVVMPVPLSSRRRRERGFNQADDLARIVSEHFGLSVNANSLKRIRVTKQQVGLTRNERQANMKDAFAWEGNALAPKNILLVDDVCTTGATLTECARVLREHGASLVWGLVLARD